jgi:hypothetical protein
MATPLTITTIARRHVGALVLSTSAAAGMIGLTTAATVAAAPACTQWGFPGPFSLQQKNNSTVRFNSRGSVASGLAEAATINGGLRGHVRGGIQGDKLDFTIRWDNAPPMITVRPPPEAAGDADGAPFPTSAPAIVPGAFAAGGKTTRDGTGTTGMARMSLRAGPSAGGTTAWTVLGVNTGAAWAAGWEVGEPPLPNSTTPSAAPR